MILLAVLSYNGVPVEGLAARFDELGGTIGRADNNHLVLPDPERTISRVHARVVFRSRGYAIVDNGSNPISVNDTVLGTGRETLLQPGDQIQIGGYVLKVSAPAAAATDPFADLFGDAAIGLAAPAPAAAPAFAPVSAPVPVRPLTQTLSPGYIPDDWNPFAADDTPTSTPLLPDASASLGPADTLDSLFGLSGAPAGGDPFGAPSGSVPDHVSELNTPMPRVRPVVPPLAPVRPSVPPPGAVFSWDTSELPELPGRVAAPSAASAGMASGSAPAAVPEATKKEAPRPVPSAPATPAVAHPPAHAEAVLLAALLEGLDAPNLRLEALTPELMRLVGQLLRESMRGTLELLLARTALKREMRAEMTMIVSRENNPLKFSPSVEVALQHLLAAPAPGFMPPGPAVRDAFNDLRAHQLGVMAGMNAALQGVLQRFDPQRLESKLTHRSAISSLIPSMRKARLWELFQELFSQLSSEAEDDFEELFGQEFVLAYEAQLDRLHGESGPG